jgi:hypothetical protein
MPYNVCVSVNLGSNMASPKKQATGQVSESAYEFLLSEMVTMMVLDSFICQ